MIDFNTERLKLREFTRDDLDELAQMSAEPETRGFLWEGAVDRETAARNLGGWMEEMRVGLDSSP
jgi:RimJ/RimL family protein N-acetyltransferase